MKSTGTYEVPSVMAYGLPSTANKLSQAHPLETSERNFSANQEKAEMRVLRATQGMHAPLRIQMEKKAASLAGGRLPFMTSERLALQVLNGTDTSIAFQDVLNMPENRERSGVPSAEMERSLGML
ncbi:proteasome maturation protein [Neocloeon triangulifer]|uniref:proteasome maturation protein n=1 Tax=Neocloeon triangulifer TaxID=2078957 RepID=UPI00286F9354|nr:proteasome maturation protein [Neocloeon triangulifer]